MTHVKHVNTARLMVMFFFLSSQVVFFFSSVMSPIKRPSAVRQNARVTPYAISFGKAMIFIISKYFMNRPNRLLNELKRFNSYMNYYMSIHPVLNATNNILTVDMYYGDEHVATMKCVLDKDEIYFEIGRTFEVYRRRGFGAKLRAIILWCAKRAGYKKAFQESTFLSNSNTRRPRPPSAYIMNLLGFRHAPRPNYYNTDPTSEFRTLNLNANIPNVNAIIRNIMR
jgi:hypothetical protein